MTLRRPLVALLAAAALVAACGDDDDAPDETGDPPTTTTSTAPPEESTTSTTAASTTSTTAPAADPVAAAEAFMAAVFPDAVPTFGEFQQGDSQSGELEVFRFNEGGGPPNLASTLLLRLDAAGEWQVIGAVNPFVTIDTPENASTVPAGPLDVAGSARGFEATVVARAHAVDGTPIGEPVVANGGGGQAEPLPYTATVDLSTATPGDEVFVVVAGSTGLDGDSGEFSVLRLTVG